MADFLCMAMATQYSDRDVDQQPATSASISPPTSAPASSHGVNHTMHMRIVPSIDNPNRSLIFDIVERELQTAAVIKVGRFTDRAISSNHISFKSKVVSRSHCELWLGPDGKLYLRDTKSSSGTFVNHVRLSLANQESRAIEIHDGDIVQLGVDYQGGIDEIYRAVKMRFELNRTKKPRPLSYSMSAFNNLRSMTTTLSNPSSFIDSHTHPTATSPAEPSSSEVQVDECCICLYALAPFQALFVAPCSHSYHFKCIRPLLQSYPGFQCPICRCYSDLEASVAVETEEVIEKYGLSRIHSQHTHAPQSISPQDSREEARSTAALDAASASGEALESSASSSSSSPPPPASSDPPLSSTLIPSPSFEDNASPHPLPDRRATFVFDEEDEQGRAALENVQQQHQQQQQPPASPPPSSSPTSRRSVLGSSSERRLSAANLVDKLKMAFSEKRKPSVVTATPASTMRKSRSATGNANERNPSRPLSYPNPQQQHQHNMNSSDEEDLDDRPTASSSGSASPSSSPRSFTNYLPLHLSNIALDDIVEEPPRPTAVPALPGLHL